RCCTSDDIAASLPTPLGSESGDVLDSLDRAIISEGVGKVNARVTACGDKSSAKASSLQTTGYWGATSDSSEKARIAAVSNRRLDVFSRRRGASGARSPTARSNHQGQLVVARTSCASR